MSSGVETKLSRWGGRSNLRRDGEKQELIDAMSAVTAAMLLEAPNEIKKREKKNPGCLVFRINPYGSWC